MAQLKDLLVTGKTRLESLKSNEHLPSQNESYDIGSLDLRWRKGYFKELIADDLTINGSSGFLPLTGGTMTGPITLMGNDICFQCDPSQKNDSGDLIWYYTNGVEKSRIWMPNDPTIKTGPNYRLFKEDGTKLYEAKLPLADGTDATGKWEIGSAYIAAKQDAPKIGQCLTYFSGQIPIGSGAGQAYAGSLNNPNVWSFPSGQGDENGSVANVQVLRMSWGSTYWHDIFANPNREALYYRAVRGGSAGAWKKIWIQGDSVTSAVWNDYAEYRESDTLEPGYVLFENGDDTLSKTSERLQHFAGVSSDTFGFSQGETEKAKTPIAVAGRVLVYTYKDRNDYKPGDCVCAAPDGTVDIMTREEVINYPDRIVGTVSCVPTYEEWGGGEMADKPPVKVNNRIWIKVK